MLTVYVVVVLLCTIDYVSGQEIDSSLPDLRADNVLLKEINGDWQSLYINGKIAIGLINYSYSTIISNYKIIVFDDINKNDELDINTDTVLGDRTVLCCAPWTSDTITIDVSGVVRYRGAILSIVIDSDNTIKENNEQNNYYEAIPDCTYNWYPLDKKISNGGEMWRWTGGNQKTPSRRVHTTPLIFDIDKDGTSDIIFASHGERDILATENGLLRAISGLSGRDIFVSDRNVNAESSIAVADMDRDGDVEIVTISNKDTVGRKYKVVVFDNTGAIKAESGYIDERIEWGGASIADIDGDGYGEVVVCATVIDHSGRIVWRGAGGRGQVGLGCQSSVADIDMDGAVDLLAGNTLYSSLGAILWRRNDLPDGLTAIGNFDKDLLPEIVLVSDNAYIYLLNSDGSTVWGPVDIPGRANNTKGGGLPTLADYNGDGQIEIGVANNAAYTVFDSSGSIRWSRPIFDPSGRSTAAAFDFNADGAYEIAYGDEQYIRIYSGVDGSTIWEEKRPAGTSFDMPTIADVDRDNKVELFTGLSAGTGIPESSSRPPGLYAFGSSGSAWGWARAIWNQISYHVNNIDDNGVVPIEEKPSWLDHNTYRAAIVDAYRSSVSDITLSKITVSKIEGSNDYEILVRAGNGGRMGIAGGVTVAVFDGDPANNGKLIRQTIIYDKIKYNEFVDFARDEDQRIIWSAPAAGKHTIYVIADYRDILTECRIDNNIHWADVIVGETEPVATVTNVATSVMATTTLPPKENTPTSPSSTTTPHGSWKGRSYVPFLWRWRR